jgi:hypothetical protein
MSKKVLKNCNLYLVHYLFLKKEFQMKENKLKKLLKDGLKKHGKIQMTKMNLLKTF